MSYTKWIENSKIDYISPFLKLWIGFNSWYEGYFIKNSIEISKLSSENFTLLKDSKISIWDILNNKGIISIDTSNPAKQKINFTDTRYLVKNNFSNYLRNELENEILSFWKILTLDTLNDSEYISKIIAGIEYKDTFRKLLSNKEFTLNILNILDRYKVIERTNLSITQEQKLIKFKNSIISINFKKKSTSLYNFIDNLKNSIGSYLKNSNEEIKDKSYTEIKGMITGLSFTDDKKDFELIYQHKSSLYFLDKIFDYIEDNEEEDEDETDNKKEKLLNILFYEEKLVDYILNIPFFDTTNTGSIFLEIDDETYYINQEKLIDNLLEIIYIIRNKLVHGELDPSDETITDLIKFSFYILEALFINITETYANT